MRGRKKRGGSPEAGIGLLRSGGALLGRNPLAIGGVTAFAVIFTFISANALWYQPHAHPGAWFQTRPFPAAVTPPEDEAATVSVIPVPRAEIERSESVQGNPTILQVQRVLAELRLYDGEADGLSGPQTREAIMQYQRVVGLPQTGSVDPDLLRHLGLQKDTSITTASTKEAEPVQGGDPVIFRIQKALRAFGNENMVVDGIAGKQTEAAVREFQTLFGLEVTGKPDRALLDKMRDLGLVEEDFAGGQ